VPSRRICATDARAPCLGWLSPDAVASPSRSPEFPQFAAAVREARALRDYDASLGLSLVVGPAHAGKVALLLERFLAVIDDDPWLIVPNRADVDRVERELIARHGAILAGTISTFDGLFEHIARGGGEERRLIGSSERALLVRRAIDATRLGRLDLHVSQSSPMHQP
jgi:hypothetical protein